MVDREQISFSRLTGLLIVGEGVLRKFQHKQSSVEGQWDTHRDFL